MKKGWKIFGIICSVTLVIGILCCVIGVGLGASQASIRAELPRGIALGPLTGDTYFGFTSVHEDSDDSEYSILADSEERFEDIRALDINMSAGEIEVKTAEKGQKDIVVTTTGIIQKLKFKCYSENQKLKITTSDKMFHINKQSVGTVTIYIPEAYQLEKAEFDIGVGALYIEDILAKKLEIDVDAGEAEIQSFYADEVDMSCDVGQITAEGEARKKAELSCDIGQISYTAIGNEKDYNYEIETSLGEISCGDQEFSGMDVEQKINNRASKDMKISCDIGSVEVDFRSK